jgi:hypothetical protein
MSVINSSHAVDVLFYFDGNEQYARPVRLSYDGQEYELGGVQFWYAEHRGGARVHHYTLSDTANTRTFELALETENLTWTLVSASDEDRSARPVRRFNLVGALS